MRRSHRFVIVGSIVAGLAAGSASADAVEAFLPQGVTYDAAVPKPESVLGHEVGERHVRHDRLLRYVETLADHSPRLRLEIQGRTHEGRPQPLLIVSAPDNLARLEQIREAHLALSDPSSPPPSREVLESMPAVVWLGYSVHGNEASGANAAPLTAYHLAAASDDAIGTLLRDTVILIDPCFNPDGLDRFAQWVNMHRGSVPVGDPQHREHREVWPGGRTNHYWFDLNRDWLLLQHPESRNRMKTFRRWMPNLVGDYHEMGSRATYFFQPGVPERHNPLIPDRNYALTERIARHHARALDGKQALYYTRETFDDFYPGKGSTYPDLNGAVGVLFEQASARGHLQDTPNGELSFAFAIDNQFRTSLSMLDAIVELRVELLDYQVQFYREALREARASDVAAYVVTFPGDPARSRHMLELLAAHDIRVHRLARPLRVDDKRYDPADAWIVPVEQPQFRLLTSLFEQRTQFESTTFYDVSAWTLPSSFGATWATVARRGFSGELVGAPIDELPELRGRFAEAEGALAWAFPWDGYYAPRALHRLLEAGVRARVATRPFSVAGRQFDYGTIVIPAGVQEVDRNELLGLLRTAAERDGTDVVPLTAGLSGDGIDLGSPAMLPLKLPKILIGVGRGISSYEAGAAWHLLDHRFRIPVSLVELDRFQRIDLDAYTHIVLVDGSFDAMRERGQTALGDWLRAGGTLIAIKRAAAFAEMLTQPQPANGDAPAPPGPPPGPPPDERATGETQPDAERPQYADFEERRSRQFLAGTIFEVELDPTHPLAFGVGRPRLSVFRNGRTFLAPSDNPYENVALYTDAPLLAGYASDENLAKAAGSAALIASRVGAGTLVRFSDDPNFRGVWYGTNKLFLNAIFFGPAVKRTPMPDRDTSAGEE